jgi:hypothetical protein
VASRDGHTALLRHTAHRMGNGAEPTKGFPTSVGATGWKSTCSSTLRTSRSSSSSSVGCQVVVKSPHSASTCERPRQPQCAASRTRSVRSCTTKSTTQTHHAAHNIITPRGPLKPLVNSRLADRRTWETELRGEALGGVRAPPRAAYSLIASIARRYGGGMHSPGAVGRSRSAWESHALMAEQGGMAEAEGGELLGICVLMRMRTCSSASETIAAHTVGLLGTGGAANPRPGKAATQATPWRARAMTAPGHVVVVIRLPEEEVRPDAARSKGSAALHGAAVDQEHAGRAEGRAVD